MIWLTPWAWIGVAGVALPIAIHLLGRGHARVHRFPTLRFLDASRLLPTRRTRIHDPLLLAVRCAVIIFAAAALARPLVVTAARRQSLDRGLARAIVVDSSASMRRSMASGIIALDSARREARTLAGEAQTSVTVESNDPARSLAAASAWLARQGRRGELIVISDFQRGQIDSSDFSIVPKGFGVTLRRLPLAGTGALESESAVGSVRVAARTTRVGDRSDVEWSGVGGAPSTGGVILLGTDADRAALTAIHDAAATLATPLPIDTTRGIAIVFPSYAGRSAVESSLRPVSARWMVDLVARLAADSVPVAKFGLTTVEGRDRFALFTNSEPASFAAARLTTDANSALSIAPPERELEPDVLSDAELTALQRPAIADVPAQLHPLDDNGPTDARWLWIGALVLLLAELVLRRQRATQLMATAEERARAA